MHFSTLILSILTISCLLVSCKTDDELSELQLLNGTWSLEKETGGRLNYTLAYEEGKFALSLNTDSPTLTIENNDINTYYKDYYQHLKSGTYDYEIKKKQEDYVLYVNDRQIGYLSVTSESLVVDERSPYNNFVLRYRRATK